MFRMLEPLQPSSQKQKRRVCIIGAGLAGLVAVKCSLHENDNQLEPVCLERTCDIGGTWRYERTKEDIQAHPSVMSCTSTNISKELMAFSDFPPPDNFPNIMHHSHYFTYLRLYAKHFGCEPHIRFQCEVKNVSCLKDQWEVEYRDHVAQQDRTEVFDAVIVTTGCNSTSNRPQFPGLERFPGRVLHSTECRNPAEDMATIFQDKRVLVIGLGDSGADLACALTPDGTTCRAKQVFLSTKSGALIVPKINPSNGMPFDVENISRLNSNVMRVMGPRLCSQYVSWMINRQFDHRKFQVQPELDKLYFVFNDELRKKLEQGSIVIKRQVKQFLPPASVEFVDGSVEHDIGVVLLATGFLLNFPFLESSQVLRVQSLSAERPTLYHYIFPTWLPKPHSLALIGFLRVNGPVPPLFEMQARWATKVIAGQIQLPDRAHMEQEMEAQAQIPKSLPFDSQRLLFRADYIPYMDALGSLLGCSPPVNSILQWLREPRLMWTLYFGPFTAYQYRLWGPGAWNRAREAILTQHERIIKGLPEPHCSCNKKQTPYSGWKQWTVLGLLLLLASWRAFGAGWLHVSVGR